MRPWLRVPELRACFIPSDKMSQIASASQLNWVLKNKLQRNVTVYIWSHQPESKHLPERLNDGILPSKGPRSSWCYMQLKKHHEFKECIMINIYIHKSYKIITNPNGSLIWHLPKTSEIILPVMIWVGYLSDRKLKNDRMELHMEQSCTNTRIEWLAKKW